MLAQLTAPVLAAIGLLASIVGLYDFFDRRRSRKVITWKQVDDTLVELIHHLNSSSFNPNMILGVGRGGSIIAAMLATNLEGRIPLAFVDTRPSLDEHGHPACELVNTQSVPSLEGLDVLIVVAELYTGLDMRAALHFVEGASPRSQRSLAMFGSPNAVVRTTYLGHETKYQPLAPWRITDESKRGRI